ncbi:disease resistance protein RPM1-like isoform X2 [Populus trichocarpa]|uniref:disease resistance protein RPM1-like isoform X2 n=1 Tax=Populus trichocarpa TaxID=3694 RepID=UPI0022785F58|nr:disease resistance protein RPM1-like isoform X2 [Populus trichocarpa]
MSEGVVTFLLTKLGDFLAERGKQLAGVQGEAEYISDELEFMTAFLRLADAIEDGDPVLKCLIKKVRDAAYDTEDALDNFSLSLASDTGHGFFSCFRKISRSIKDARARSRIASKIQSIKSRVVSISESHRRYCNKNNIMIQGSSSINIPRLGCQKDALLLEEADLVGIEKPKKQMIEWLLGSKSGREVISVVGMGGLGKSTLVKKVYDDSDVKKHFKFRAWITVSQSFKREDLLKDMIQQLFRVHRKPDPKGVDNMNYNKLRSVIHEFLRQKKYLIVLDDVWHTSAWRAFQHALPNNICGSRILVTTRNTEVASTSCMDSPDKVYPLNPLSQEESWTLFCKKIFQDNPRPPHLKNVSETILGRCEGLPLAIVAISGVLATKDKSKTDEWEMVHLSLGVGLEENDMLMSARKILSLSYNDLPYYLKSCLLYFSIFPVGNRIKRMRLIRLWIAEGFVKGKEGMTVEEVAQDYLNELMKRSLVQVVKATSDGRVKTCRVHDLLREIMITKAKDQDFVAIAKEEGTIWPEKVRRVSMHNVMPSKQQRHVASRFRSLLTFWVADCSYESPVHNLFSGRLRLLHVLDLEGAPLKEFPNEVVSLFLLKYLSLRNTRVSFIPSSISKLKNLETLDLKHAQVSVLPAEIRKLRKLCYLLVYRYEIDSDDRIPAKYGFKAPAHIGGLQSIQKLCFVEAHQGRNLMLELGRLKQLRRLGIVKLKKKHGKALCSSIERLTNLRALSLTSITESEIIDLDYLASPPQFLQRLYLAGRMEKFPDWISSLDSLVKLVLKWSKLSEDPLLSLQYLPNLVHLEFVQVYNGEILCFQAKGFQRLKFLGLNKLDRLRIIIVERGAMPSLEKMIVQSCKSLRRVPSGIEHLSTLKVLEFFNMPKELVMTLHPNGEDGDYLKVAHVPDVYSTYWNNGNWDIFSLLSAKLEDKHSAQLSPTLYKRNYTWK